MDNTLRLRIASIFVLFSASFLGIMIPLIGIKNQMYKSIVPLLQTGSAGIMLGLAMIHLSPEANEVLGEMVPDYPLGYALTGLGIMIVLGIEQGVLLYTDMRRLNKQESKKSQSSKQLVISHRNLSSDSLKDPEHTEACGFVSCEHDDKPRQVKIVDHDHDHDHDHGHDHGHGHDHAHYEAMPPSKLQQHQQPEFAKPNQHNHGHSGPCSSSCAPVASNKDHSHEDHGHSDSDHHGHDHADHDLLAIQDLADAETMQELVLAYALELSTAIHSTIIGVNLGLLDSYNTISILLIALCFHQFVEGLGVGQVLDTNKSVLGHNKLIIFVVVFSCTVSIGVLIGILTAAQGQSEGEEGAKSVATALASGSLLYTSLVEMAGHYFSSPQLHSQPGKRMAMLFSFMFGFGCMALIGTWA